MATTEDQYLLDQETGSMKKVSVVEETTNNNNELKTLLTEFKLPLYLVGQGWQWFFSFYF